MEAPNKENSSSPPTQRVMDVVELLAASTAPQSSAEVADQLGLNRSTVGSILAALDARGWVRRGADLRYVIGPLLASIGDHARHSLAAPTNLADELSRLAARNGYATGLSAIHRDQLVVLALVESVGRIPAGMAVGSRLPLQPPAGASIMAFKSAPEQSAWLSRAEPHARPQHKRTLDVIKEERIGVWGGGAADSTTMDVLSDVVQFLAVSPDSTSLRERIVTLLATLTGVAYMPEELARAEPLPVSVITAPVFDNNGNASWELQIGPFARAVTKSERQRLIAEMTTTAKRLSAAPVDDQR